MKNVLHCNAFDKNTNSMLVGGAYYLKDTTGFPLDLAHDVAKENGWYIDWVDVALEAGSHGILKYDSVLVEIDGIVGSDVVRRINELIMLYWHMEGKPSEDGWFEAMCRKYLNEKRSEG